MPYLRSILGLVGFTVLVPHSLGFAVRAPRIPVSKSTGLQMVSHVKDETVLPDLVKAFGVISLASVLAFQLPSDVSATTSDQFISATSSSSIQVAAAVRTMDMSMPTYDKISDSQTSSENLQDLSFEMKKETGDTMGIPTSKSKKATAKNAKAVAKQKVEVEKEDKPDPKIKIVDMDLPSYTDTTATKEKGAFSL